jgi:hypothetical protein
MTETKITKVNYVIQFYLEDIDKWSNSDWNNGVKYKTNLSNMLELLRKARDSDAEKVKTFAFKPKPYRLVRQTHSITTEVVDE